MQSGQVPLAELLLVQFGNEDPIYEISAIPFLADTVEKAQKLWSVSRGALSDRLAKDGIRLLYGVTWPVQGFYAKTPITSVANFKGVKMRTYSAMTGRMAKEMGAIPPTSSSARSRRPSQPGSSPQCTHRLRQASIRRPGTTRNTS